VTPQKNHKKTVDLHTPSPTHTHTHIYTHGIKQGACADPGDLLFYFLFLLPQRIVSRSAPH